MSIVFIKAPDGYCACCCDEARKHGRPTRMTDLYEYELCGLCENRMREGLVFYRPSNGTEFDMFLDRCFRCRHYTDDLDNPKPGRLEAPFNCCKWGVLDRFYVNMMYKRDHHSSWFDPQDLKRGCPAVCLRYCHKDDEYGDRTDPPPIDAPGQMMLVDALPVIVERVPACAAVEGA